MAGNLHHTTPAWYGWRDGPHASVTAHGAGRADGPEPPQLPGSVHPGRGAARDQSPTCTCPTRRPDRCRRCSSSATRWCRRSPGGWATGARALRLAAIGVFVWSAATFGSGLAPTFAGAAGRARADRRRRGELHGGHAVPAVRLLSGRSPRARAGDLLRGDPGRHRPLGYVLGGADRGALRLAGGVLRRGSTGGRSWRSSLLVFRDPPRGRFDAVRSPRAAPTVRDSVAASCAARPSFIYNTVAQTIYTFASAASPFWMPTYFCGRATCPTPTRLAEVRRRAAARRLRRHPDRRARRAIAVAASQPDGHFLLSGVASDRVAAVHAARGPPSLACYLLAGDVRHLLLLFLNTGPLNAAMANVPAAQLRGPRVRDQHRGDSPPRRRAVAAADRRASPIASACATPVLVTGLLLVVAGLVLLAGRAALRRDLQAAAVPA